MENSNLIWIIGIGNEYRSDDGIGIHIARRLRKLNIPCLNPVFNVKDGAELMELWKDKTHVILIDAVSTGSEPGMIFRFDVSEKGLPEKFTHRSSHNLSVAEAVELSRNFFQLPAKLIIYGIEGKDFSHGEELSDQVKKASDVVIDLILQETRTPTQQLNHIL